jgi:hypothetical protein
MTDAEREADLNRSGEQLALHTIRTVFAMAEEAKATPTTVASMLSSMANAHRIAADKLDRAALQAKLNAAAR